MQIVQFVQTKNHTNTKNTEVKIVANKLLRAFNDFGDLFNLHVPKIKRNLDPSHIKDVLIVSTNQKPANFGGYLAKTSPHNYPFCVLLLKSGEKCLIEGNYQVAKSRVKNALSAQKGQTNQDPKVGFLVGGMFGGF
jgi:hypothetical protein